MMDQTVAYTTSLIGTARQRLRQWLVEPAALIPTQGSRRQARLLAILLLVLAPFMALGAFWSWQLRRDLSVSVTLTAGAVCLALAYGLSRTRSYRLGAVVAVAITFVIPFITPALYLERASTDTLESLIWVAVTIFIGDAVVQARGRRSLAVPATNGTRAVENVRSGFTPAVARSP